ncbi:MAG: hypothetical protein V2A54_02025 [Bacteroidota bacterium]
MHKKLAFTTVLSLLLISAIALAAPGIPNRFHGYVNFLNGAAPDGLLVEAKIGGTMVASATTAGGKYGFAPNVFDVTDPYSNRNGSTISFFVGGVDTGKTANFTNGDSDELNFTINGYVNEIPSADRIENQNVTVAPTSPATVRMGDNMNLTLSSSSAGIVSIRKVEKLSDGFYAGSFAVISGMNVLNGYEINISGNVNITAIMKYSDSGIDETTVKPYKFDGIAWVELPILYRDTTANTITFDIPSAQTPYAIFASPAAADSPTTSTGGTTGGTAPPSECAHNWSCSAWSSCVNSLQTRSCTDSNNCGTTEGRPALSQSCSNTPASPETPSASETEVPATGNNTTAPAGPTGTFLGVENTTWYGVIIGVAIIGLLVYAFKKGKIKIPGKVGLKYNYKK